MVDSEWCVPRVMASDNYSPFTIHYPQLVPRVIGMPDGDGIGAVELLHQHGA